MKLTRDDVKTVLAAVLFKKGLDHYKYNYKAHKSLSVIFNEPAFIEVDITQKEKIDQLWDVLCEEPNQGCAAIADAYRALADLDDELHDVFLITILEGVEKFIDQNLGSQNVVH